MLDEGVATFGVNGRVAPSCCGIMRDGWVVASSCEGSVSCLIERWRAVLDGRGILDGGGPIFDGGYSFIFVESVAVSWLMGVLMVDEGVAASCLLDG